MGGGISVCNETGIEVIVTLSQVGPLHWDRVQPGETKTIECGQVWFTVTTRLWDGNEPTGWDVAKPFVVGIGAGAAIVATGAIAAPFLGGAAVGVGAGAVTTEGAVAAGAGAGAVAGAASALGAGVGVASALASDGTKSPADMKRENYDKWVSITPSERSARWLADNHVVAIVPAKETGVYADGKTITIRHELSNVNGNARMTLKMLGT